MKALVLGAGFSGLRIARSVPANARVVGTRRSAAGCAELEQHGVPALLFSEPGQMLGDDLRDALAEVTHLVVSVPPAREAPLRDDALSGLSRLVADDAHALSALQWIGYLSTIGVYGDHGGQWVDEGSECQSQQPRSQMRLAAEQGWQSLAAELQVPLAVLRLSGIYGPGRNAVVDALAGRARRLIKAGQVFNRVHVDDIARAAMRALDLRAEGIFNITDDCPAPPQDVVSFAHALTNRAPPPIVDFATAELSAMARSFYSENKRVRNQRSKDVLGLKYAYPNYQVGLQALLGNAGSGVD